MWRIIFAFFVSTVLVLARLQTSLLDAFSWAQLFAFVAAGEFGLLLLSIPKPVTQFVTPPALVSHSQHTKLEMLKRVRAKCRNRVRLQLSGGEWINGCVIQLSRCAGTVTLQREEQGEPVQDLVAINDIVRVQAPMTPEGAILASDDAFEELPATT